MKNLRKYISQVLREGMEIKRMFDSPEPFENFRNVKQVKPEYPDKPKGLWYSCGEEWREWVESEGFGERYEYSYEVQINSSALYMIRSVAEMERFHETYAVNGKYEKVIDWKAVQDDGYAGIEICPYRNEKRMDSDYFWYYPWDVASGCIWNESGILEVKELKR